MLASRCERAIYRSNTGRRSLMCLWCFLCLAGTTYYQVSRQDIISSEPELLKSLEDCLNLSKAGGLYMFNSIQISVVAYASLLSSLVKKII